MGNKNFKKKICLCRELVYLSEKTKYFAEIFGFWFSAPFFLCVVCQVFLVFDLLQLGSSSMCGKSPANEMYLYGKRAYIDRPAYARLRVEQARCGIP